MVRRRPKRTTLRPNSSRSSSWSSRGFTLIEILIVTAIIAMVITLGLPAIERVTYQRVNSTTRRFIGMMRTIRNDAILLNTIQRLAIDFENKTYWVEAQKQLKLLGEEEAENERKKKKLKKGESLPSNFAYNPKYSKEPIPFPGGVAIDGVLKEGVGVVKTGVAYVHFFPNGFNEQAILYINKEGSTSGGYSLWIHSNLGKVDVFRQRIASFDQKVGP